MRNKVLEKVLNEIPLDVKEKVANNSYECNINGEILIIVEENFNSLIEKLENITKEDGNYSVERI
jgi:hypothetical protein